MDNKINSEAGEPYASKRRSGDDVIDEARSIIIARFDAGEVLTSPDLTRNYVQTLLGAFEHEVFAMITLNNRNGVLGWHEMFRGTVDGASVYPREVVKIALADNAAAVIFAHNHPSGITEPSQADIRITERLKKALELIDIRVLDHVIIGADVTSLAERGLI